MKLIQVVILGALCLFLILYLTHFRSKLRDRLILIVLLGISVYFVLDPDACSALANQIGVGRGTDLVLYLGLMFLTFTALLLYSRHRVLESRFTHLVRSIAIIHARPPGPVIMHGGDPEPLSLAATPARQARAG